MNFTFDSETNGCWLFAAVRSYLFPDQLLYGSPHLYFTANDSVKGNHCTSDPCSETTYPVVLSIPVSFLHRSARQPKRGLEVSSNRRVKKYLAGLTHTHKESIRLIAQLRCQCTWKTSKRSWFRYNSSSNRFKGFFCGNFCKTNIFNGVLKNRYAIQFRYALDCDMTILGNGVACAANANLLEYVVTVATVNMQL